MAKISIPVNPRDLIAELQKHLLTPERVSTLLMSLERIATKKTDDEPFKLGVASLRYVDGRLDIEPESEEIFTEPVLVTLFRNEDKMSLIALHSQLYTQLFKLGEKNGDQPAVVANWDENVSESPQNEDKFVVTINEKKLYAAIEKVLRNLSFDDLLVVNKAVIETIGTLKKETLFAAPRYKNKRLIEGEGVLTLEIESKETSAGLVSGLLRGLEFSSLMKLSGEILGLITKANAREKEAPEQK